VTTDARTAAVFFDLDGTLIDTAPDMGGALNRLLHRHGRAQVTESIYRPQVSHGSLALLRLSFNSAEDEPRMPDLRREFLAEYESGIANESRLFPGIDHLLAELDQRAIPWGIITNKPEALTLLLTDALDLTKRCCCIIGADTAARAKPHPEPMLLACDRSAVNPEQCLYLGDAQRDIQAGNAVGMTTLIAAWGYIGSDEQPASWKADGSLREPADTLSYLH